MNRQRRKKISKIVDELTVIADQVDYLETEERDAFENLPESIQESERGTKMEETADTLAEIQDELTDLISRLWEAQE